MTFEKSEKFKEANDLLKTVLPQYQFISEAPKTPNDYQRQQEKHKKYKATDSAGNVYLIQNPAAWEDDFRDDQQPIKIRPKPELIMTFADLKKAAAGHTDKTRELFEPKENYK